MSPAAHEAALFGRRAAPDGDALFGEAADAVEVVRRLWDSWEDDAVIRDVATGRYIDRDKLHYIDFDGKYFSVKGPSITPRPPQGQPVVTALAHAERYEFAAAQRRSGLRHPTRRGLATCDSWPRSATRGAPRAERSTRTWSCRWPRSVGAGGGSPSDAHVFIGNASDLAELLLAWQDAGVDGVRLRPAINAIDLPAIVDDLVPRLQHAGRFRTGYRDGETLRERLGLASAPNRYATAPS